MRKMLVVRVRKKFWLLAIFTSSCLIVLNLLISPHPSSSLLEEDNSVFLGESLEYSGFLPKDPDRAVTGVQIVGLDDLPAIKPMGRRFKSQYNITMPSIVSQFCQLYTNLVIFLMINNRQQPTFPDDR